ncbi:MAG: 30S ribosomal protein S6 [Bacteroidota bacterium]|nr:30S ribosomal protein S6 [Bacteroidota bacterium]
MLNQYETVFISTPVLSEAQTKETVEKFKDLIKNNGGEIVHEENWGLKKLAYTIGKKATGYYYLIEFKAEGTLIEKLETEYRRDEKIIRFLSFKMDKYSVAYSEKKRNTKAPKAEAK